MKTFFTLIITLILLTGCQELTHQVESTYDNGNDKIIFYSLFDTIIHGKSFTRKFKIKFNEKGDTLRKGVYIDQMALGEHSFYEKNKVNCKRNYIIPNPFFIDLDNNNEVLDFGKFKIKEDSTYLNTAVYFDLNGDSIISKSHFYSTKSLKNKWKINDSLEVQLKFHCAGYKVIKSDLYFIVPQDTSKVRLIFDAGDNYTFKRKIHDKDNNRIKGFVEITAIDKTKSLNDFDEYIQRIIFIDDVFEIE